MKTLQTALKTASQSLQVDVDELQLWLDQQIGVPLYSQVQLLRLAGVHQLDPLIGDIDFIANAENNYQPFITIDGWVKLINRHPQYVGMSLRESQEVVNEIPTWMECTIYRNDRILPIIIKEYFEEVKTDQPSWLKMPRRMLRHRVIQQCARMAFAISASESIYHSKNNQNTSEINQIYEIKESKSKTDQLKEILRK